MIVDVWGCVCGCVFVFVVVVQVVVESENKEKKKMKGSVLEEGESKATEQNSNKENSKGNSKLSDVQKTDYIHVRARRGQATDSHSLAERVSSFITPQYYIASQDNIYTYVPFIFYVYLEI